MRSRLFLSVGRERRPVEERLPLHVGRRLDAEEVQRRRGYVHDRRVFEVDPAAGTVTRVAGSDTPGSSGDNGPADLAEFDGIGDIVLDRSGDLWIADNGNHRIRRIDASTGEITTVAGNGDSGIGADGEIATDIPLGTIGQLAVDVGGHLYFAERSTFRVRRVDGATGRVGGKRLSLLNQWFS